ncbi:tetratricopeptide repeat protein [Promicromonospora sp. NPDC023805]|uniref:ATP-binding protein n=1 Tax=Promicromonospora sp. NPDC023805 TaxID=3154696 RepID=UPI0033C562C9
MGVLSRPEISHGPLQVLFDDLHALHHRAGRPSLRQLAAEVGCSRTTVAAVFSEPRPPRWGLLELIVEALGGDVAAFHELWLTATEVPTTHQEPLPAPRPVPSAALRQAPAPVGAFAGRDELLERMDRVLLPDTDGVPICVLTGTPGVGKTALALQWAHRRADRFRGGVLYVDLHGYHATAPALAHDVLAEFIRALSAPGRQVPDGTRERAALYRTLTAERPVLVLLDNARSVDQVDELIPGAPGAAALITSREDLSGAVVRYGATRLEVQLMAEHEAVDLLGALVGDRVASDAEATRTLAARCARLPLALRVAAELVATRPDEPLGDILDELTSAARLSILDRGDDYSAVRTVFSWSYQRLSADAARLFRLLPVHPGTSLESGAAAALLGTHLGAGRQYAEELARGHLVERLRGGRFAMHDLLREYAGELLEADPILEVQAARRRLFDTYCDDAAAAARVLPDSAPLPSVPPMPPAGNALRWLRAERPTLLAVAQISPRHALLLSESLHPLLDTGGHYDEAATLHRCALTAAQGNVAQEAAVLDRLGTIRRRQGDYEGALLDHQRAAALCDGERDGAGLGRALHNIGVIQWRTGRYREARDSLGQALNLQRDAGDVRAQGSTQYSLGIVERRLGRYREALEHHQAAMRIFEGFADITGLGRATNNAAVVHLQLGNFAEAEAALRRALDIQLRRADRAAESVVLINLALVMERTGRLHDAAEALEKALAIASEIGYPVGIADALRGLGVVRGREGRTDEGVELLQKALQLGRQLGEGEAQTGACIELAELLLNAGRAGEAEPPLREAEERALAAGERYEVARARAGLARVAAAAGADSEARSQRESALATFTELGIPEAAWPSIARREG